MTITRKQLAERWNISVATLRRMERLGTVTPVKLNNGRVHYWVKEITEIEEKLTKAGYPPEKVGIH